MVRTAWKSTRPVLLVSGAVLFLATFAFAASDAMDGFCDRLPMPSDIGDLSVKGRTARNNLVTVRSDLRKELIADRDTLAEQTARGEIDKEQFVLLLQQKSKEKQEIYLVEARTTATCDAGFSDYWRHSSLRAKWAGVLTLAGGLIVTFILWILLLHSVTGIRLSQREQEPILMIFSILTPWLLLRAYSEWWINFGAPSDYQPFVPVVVAAAAVAFLAAFLKVRRPRLVITASTITGVSAIAAALAKWKLDWFDVAARAFAALDLVYLVAVYLVVSLVVIAAVSHAFRGIADD